MAAAATSPDLPLLPSPAFPLEEQLQTFPDLKRLRLLQWQPLCPPSVLCFGA